MSEVPEGANTITMDELCKMAKAVSDSNSLAYLMVKDIKAELQEWVSVHGEKVGIMDAMYVMLDRRIQILDPRSE